MKFELGADQLADAIESCPARGTWIEIMVLEFRDVIQRDVVPRKGHVD